MSTNTTQAVFRSGPRKAGVYAGSMVMAARAAFDPTSTTQVELFTLPAGAVPLGVTGDGGATGGTSPTVIVGTAADDDGFAAAVDADGVSVGNSGALTGTELSADTVVYGKVGASAATGGTVTITMEYMRVDPKSGENV